MKESFGVMARKTFKEVEAVFEAEAASERASLKPAGPVGSLSCDALVRLCVDCVYFRLPDQTCRREMRSPVSGKVDFQKDWGLSAHQARLQYCGVQAIFFQPNDRDEPTRESAGTTQSK